MTAVQQEGGMWPEQVQQSAQQQAAADAAMCLGPPAVSALPERARWVEPSKQPPHE
jgi:hypothetical protein